MAPEDELQPKKRRKKRRPARRAGEERPGAARKVRRRTPPPEPPPVVSGRFIAAALIVAPMLIPMSPLDRVFKVPAPEPTDTSSWKVGETAEFDLTLITADYDRLACAHDQAVAGKHCAFKGPTEPWPRDPSDPIDDTRADVIQPYRTWPDNLLVMVAGLWAEPRVATRLHREPPAGVAPNRLARFVASCKMKFIGRVDRPHLRWAPGQQWQQEPGPVLVAEPVSCRVDGEGD